MPSDDEDDWMKDDIYSMLDNRKNYLQSFKKVLKKTPCIIWFLLSASSLYVGVVCTYVEHNVMVTKYYELRTKKCMLENLTFNANNMFSKCKWKILENV